jgi:hypothetical protein
MSPFKICLVLFFLSFTSVHAKTKEDAKWGKLICEAVTAEESETFAKDHHFIDNFYFDRTSPAEPPYVPPKGTLACVLPLQFLPFTDIVGAKSYSVSANFVDSPFKPSKCRVTYFGNSRARTFAQNGGGSGLVAHSDDDTSGRVDGYFSDFGSVHEEDDFLVSNVEKKAQVMWTPETPDSEPHVPIVSRCRVEIEH